MLGSVVGIAEGPPLFRLLTAHDRSMVRPAESL
jgi:hypothetical protein